MPWLVIDRRVEGDKRANLTGDEARAVRKERSHLGDDDLMTKNVEGAVTRQLAVARLESGIGGR